MVISMEECVLFLVDGSRHITVPLPSNTASHHERINISHAVGSLLLVFLVSFYSFCLNSRRLIVNVHLNIDIKRCCFILITKL